MSTSQLRFRRKIGNALYGEAMQCEPHQCNQDISPPPLNIVAVKCMSLPLATDVRNRSRTARTLDDQLQECRAAELLAKKGGHRAPISTSKNISEYCADGDLYTQLAATSNHVMDEQQTTHIFVGVDYLHNELGIAHHDLSLENALVHNGECKISDFRLFVPVDFRCTQRADTECYMVPGVVAGETYDPVKADI